MPKKKRIRPLALCVFLHEDRIFVSEGYDKVKDQIFYRPIGGRIEFGERAEETIHRELMEEIKQSVTDLKYIGTLENIFTYEGNPGHEIVLIFTGRFVDESLYAPDTVLQGIEEDVDDLLFEAMWKPLDFFRDGNAPLYPTGIIELLTS